MSRLCGLALAALLAHPALAAGAEPRIEAEWARASITADRPGVAYMTLVNTGDAPVTVTDAATPVAGRAEFHRTVRDGEIMGMKPVDTIRVGAGETVTLMPGGLHIMLMELERALKEGGRFPLTLTLADGRRLETEIPVLGPGARGP